MPVDSLNRLAAKQQDQERQKRQAKLCPRKRKRIQGLATKRVPKEEWMVHQKGLVSKFTFYRKRDKE